MDENDIILKCKSKTGFYVVNGSEFWIEIYELLGKGLSETGKFLTY